MIAPQQLPFPPSIETTSEQIGERTRITISATGFCKYTLEENVEIAIQDIAWLSEPQRRELLRIRFTAALAQIFQRIIEHNRKEYPK